MLLAPFTLTESFVDRRREASKRLPDVPSWLLVWAIGGLVAFALFSSLRGGGFAGMSMPFWLVGAPLINLAWRAWALDGEVARIHQPRPRRPAPQVSHGLATTSDGKGAG